ncbi:MAG: DsrE family protein [Gammaproteobacteria bacterium]|nr:DsrE family protein [Gammaproteobacteria bacterium]
MNKKHLSHLLLLLMLTWPVFSFADKGARFVQTPYTEQKVVYDFYFDEPAKIAQALYWLRSQVNTLNNEPYNIAPDFNEIKVVIHGTEIVTLAKKNYARYQTVVERMKYYAEFGIEFKVCATAANDYGYELTDFYDFVDVVPNSLTEIAHWQLQGYALITPKVPIKRYSIEDIR